VLSGEEDLLVGDQRFFQRAHARVPPRQTIIICGNMTTSRMGIMGSRRLSVFSFALLIAVALNYVLTGVLWRKATLAPTTCLLSVSYRRSRVGNCAETISARLFEERPINLLSNYHFLRHHELANLLYEGR